MRWRLAVAVLTVACESSPPPAVPGTTGETVGETSSSSSTTASDASSSTGGDSSGGGSSSTTAAPDGPPVVVDVGKSVMSVTEGERAEFTAFVHHPRGDDAVVSGVLLGPGDPAEYSAFTRGVAGRWHTEVSWDDVVEHWQLDFVEELQVEFTARFVDDAGREGERTVTLRHRCIVLAPYACDGICSTEPACG